MIVVSGFGGMLSMSQISIDEKFRPSSIVRGNFISTNSYDLGYVKNKFKNLEFVFNIAFEGEDVVEPFSAAAFGAELRTRNNRL